MRFKGAKAGKESWGLRVAVEVGHERDGKNKETGELCRELRELLVAFSEISEKTCLNFNTNFNIKISITLTLALLFRSY